MFRTIALWQGYSQERRSHEKSIPAGCGGRAAKRRVALLFPHRLGGDLAHLISMSSTRVQRIWGNSTVRRLIKFVKHKVVCRETGMTNAFESGLFIAIEVDRCHTYLVVARSCVQFVDACKVHSVLESLSTMYPLYVR